MRVSRFRRWTWAHRLIACGFLLVLVGSYHARQPWLEGSATATLLLSRLPFVDPLAAAEVLVASRHATPTLLLGAGTTILLTLVLGRAFCGWLCPLGLVLEMRASMQRRIRQRMSHDRLRWPTIGLAAEWKYGVLAAFLVLSAIASLPVFTAFSPINLVVLSADGWVLPTLIILLVILVIETLAPRVFCRSLCPLGALHCLLGRWAPLRIRVRPEGQHTACRQCTIHCPMGIRVLEDYILAGKNAVDDPECTKCGICTDVCPGSVLRLGFRTPARELESGLQDAAAGVDRGSAAVTCSGSKGRT